MASIEGREVMDIRQAAEYLGISADTLYRYASEGFVPAFKLGNRWRFQRSRLHEWMDQQSAESAAQARAANAESGEARAPAKPVGSVRPGRPRKPARAGERG